MRKHLLGTPRGAIVPVHLPVIISCPCRRRKDPLCSLDPACRRHGMDNKQTGPLARGVGDPRPICFQIPGKLPCMVLIHAGLIEGNLWPLQAAIGGAVGSLLPQAAPSCEDHILAFFQG
jgi:hypothetical protein